VGGAATTGQIAQGPRCRSEPRHVCARFGSVCNVGAWERDGPRPGPNGRRSSPLAARVPANRLLLSRRAPGAAHLLARLPAMWHQLALRRCAPRAARCSLPQPAALVSSTLLPALDIIGSVRGARPGHSMRGEPAVYSREQHSSPPTLGRRARRITSTTSPTAPATRQAPPMPVC